jgi:hypothetical protein
MFQKMLTRLSLLVAERAVFVPNICFVVECVPFSPFRVQHLERFFPNGLGSPTVTTWPEIDRHFNTEDVMKMNMHPHMNPRDPLTWIRPEHLPVRVREHEKAFLFYQKCAASKFKFGRVYWSTTEKSPGLVLLTYGQVPDYMFYT